MNQIVAGSIAGLLATLPMTIYMSRKFHELPRHEKYPLPPREITEKITEEAGLGGRIDEETMRRLTLLAHFGYGSAVGAIYPLLLKRGCLPALLKGMAFGLGVWAFSYLKLLPTLRVLKPATEHPPERMVLMIGAHLVWGGALGLIVDALPGRAKARCVTRTASREKQIPISGSK